MEQISTITARAITDAAALRGPRGGGPFRMITGQLSPERQRLAEAVNAAMPQDADRPTPELITRMMPVVRAALFDD